MGALGFLHLHLGDQSPGNCGLLDQVAALEWVRDNVADFGADPGRVTVFGEPAGAMNIGCLLAMPAAAGLFRGAIPQSGAAASQVSVERAAEVAERLAARLGGPGRRSRSTTRVPEPGRAAACGGRGARPVPQARPGLRHPAVVRRSFGPSGAGWAPPAARATGGRPRRAMAPGRARAGQHDPVPARSERRPSRVFRRPSLRPRGAVTAPGGPGVQDSAKGRSWRSETGAPTRGCAVGPAPRRRASSPAGRAICGIVGRRRRSGEHDLRLPRARPRSRPVPGDRAGSWRVAAMIGCGTFPAGVLLRGTEARDADGSQRRPDGDGRAASGPGGERHGPPLDPLTRERRRWAPRRGMG
ncbi:MAG TPA: carboxylesterase family protein [Candidatus Dormibacteraeota bacterium]|nr:carboxylesterase family protein [Candidatus Dormibacteraeota bacterium]